MNEGLQLNTSLLINKNSEKEKELELKKSKFLNKLLFIWIFDVISIFNSINSNIKSFLGNFKSSNNDLSTQNEYIKFSYYWDEKSYRTIKNHPLLKTVIRTYLLSILYIISLSIVICLFDFINIILFKSIIDLFESNIVYFGVFDFKIISIIFVISKLLVTIISKYTTFLQNNIGSKASCLLNQIIYNQILNYPYYLITKKNGEKFSEGDIINLIQVDSTKISDIMTSGQNIFTVPFQIIIYTIYLFFLLGFSFLPGLIFLFMSLFINYLIFKSYRVINYDYLKQKDQRMSILTEVFNSIKIIKMYGWENIFYKKIMEYREKELSVLNRTFNTVILSNTYNFFLPIGSTIISIGFYIFFNGEISIQLIFTCIYVYSTLRPQIRNINMVINLIIDTVTSGRRIEEYIKDFDSPKEEENKNNERLTMSLQDLSIDNENIYIASSRKSSYSDYSINYEILYSNVTLYYIKNNEKMNILKNISLSIPAQSLVVIIGKVGSGKSTFIKSLINEIDYKGNITITNSSISYVSQVPWIENKTIKDNIVFHKEYDEVKYKKVLDMMKLNEDVKNLEYKDLTEIGHKGVNLSGGQKARVSLGRAVYSENNIVIIDDSFSSLDKDVSNYIINKCILEYLHTKTRIIVSENLDLLNKADIILYCNCDERIVEVYKGNNKDDIINNYYISQQYKPQIEINTNRDKSIEIIEDNIKNEVKRLMKEEDKSEGSVSFNVYKKYIYLLEGRFSFVLLFFILIFSQFIFNLKDIFLKHWKESFYFQENSIWYGFSIFSSISILSCILVLIRMMLSTSMSLHCSKFLYKENISSLLKADLNLYHDVTPKGIIYNRLSKDLEQIDRWIIQTLCYFLYCAIEFIFTFGICIYYYIWSLVFLPVFIIVCYVFLKKYSHPNREITRYDLLTRTPIANSISETISGSDYIRAYNYKHQYFSLFKSRLDDSFITKYIQSGLSSWFGLYLNLTTILFMSFQLIIILIKKEIFSKGTAALFIYFGMSLHSSFYELMNTFTSLEKIFISLERCLSLNQSQVEEGVLIKNKEIKKINGKIEFRNVSVKYRYDSEVVLKSISFLINSSQRVGIIGRTGSGKSSIFLSLLKIILPFEGNIYIDDIDISTINSNYLRKKITIIPQEPILFKGNLRYNIDPLKEHNENRIYEFIKEVNFLNIKYFNESSDINDILDFEIEENGLNLSFGQKQIVSIIRGLIRNNNIVIIDEGTSSIDIKYEEIVRKLMDKYLVGKTVITIAHKLINLKDYDRIIKLNNGRIEKYSENEEKDFN